MSVSLKDSLGTDLGGAVGMGSGSHVLALFPLGFVLVVYKQRCRTIMSDKNKRL